MYIEHNFPQFRLLIWTSFIGQFVHSVGEEGMGKRDDWEDRYINQLQVSLYESNSNLV